MLEGLTHDEQDQVFNKTPEPAKKKKQSESKQVKLNLLIAMVSLEEHLLFRFE
jgi:hypothetical protein